MTAVENKAVDTAAVESTAVSEPTDPAAPVQSSEPPAPAAPPLPQAAIASRPWPLWVAVIAALAGGGALLLSFPNYNLWWLAPFGVALIALAVHGRRLRAGFGLGTLAGLTLFVPMLQWTHIVGGSVPWLLLAVMEALYLGLLGAAFAYVGPLVDRHRWMWPLVTGVLWVGQEALRDRTPFGGFPWARLAFSQADSPALRFAVLGGAPLVTFVVGAAGGLVILAAVSVPQRPASEAGRTRRYVRTAAMVVGAAVVIVLGLAVPTSKPNGAAIQVAIVQGNVPRLGLEFNAQRRAVLDDHVNATRALAAEVAAGKVKQPDIVIWPENSSDIDPLITDDPDDSDAWAEINFAAQTIKAPILVGAVLNGPGTHARNAAIVWTPTGGPQSGPHGIYVKQHPVPFAEYVPLRSIARKVSSKVDLIRNDFVAGKTPGVLYMRPAAGGRVTVGDAICFEVAYDNIVRATVLGGAQLLTVQTNNADFNTAEAHQQMAMVRLRAVESGRDALMVSTVGISGFVDASGGQHNVTGFNLEAAEVRELRLGNQRTLATELGEIPEFVACAAAIAALVGAGWIRRRSRVTPE
ncbi:MAG TPA: apolipoprotein N-acyltransferase [Micromonosporaceae bacterium]